MEEPAQLQQPIAVMGSIKQEPDITKWSMDSKQLFVQMGHDLRCEISRKGQHGEEWYKPAGVEPLMNETGIIWLFTQLRPIVDKYAMQANISREEAYHIGKNTCLDILDGLYLEQHKFNMKTIHYGTVTNMILNIVHFAVTRPIEGKERDKMHESTEVHRYYTGPDADQRKQGMSIPFIGGLFRR